MFITYRHVLSGHNGDSLILARLHVEEDCALRSEGALMVFLEMKDVWEGISTV